MSVRVQSIVLAGGAPPVLKFSDSFARADQPFYVGDSWAITPLNQSTVSGPSIPAAINVAGNALNLGLISTNGVNETMLFPLLVSWNVAAFKNQFAQCSISADNSGGASFAACGPAVLMNVNLGTGYFIQTNSNGVTNVVNRYIITSMNGGAAQTSIDTNGNAGYTYALNDVLRIEAYRNTPLANQTTINHYKNGTLVNSIVDTTNHYSFGVFGIFDFFISAGITQSFQNFSGGAF